jgi:DNA polymerase III delta subunit
MLYLFYGDNRDKARTKWHAIIHAFQTKQPEGMVFHFDAENFAVTQFEELISSGGLFGEKRLVAADNLLENEGAEEFVSKNLESLISSPNTFLFLDVSLSSELVKKIEKAGGKIEEHKLALKSVPAPFNIFVINDAFITRDRKQLWLVYQKALRAGVPEEEIFWKLVWQVKTMLVVGKQKGAVKNLKPFVISKAEHGLKKFRIEELEKLSRDLVVFWHDSRRGLVDFDLGLEKLVLSI